MYFRYFWVIGCLMFVIESFEFIYFYSCIIFYVICLVYKLINFKNFSVIEIVYRYRYSCV